MKIKTVFYVIAALCLFVSASPWEGAAVAAPEGELPGNGRYIATNSFPRNTVVDIVNIETNKSTRVIVARGLDSPGLLAVVSKEAAELIGIRPGSVSRIRMTQPSEPVAYARFMEGLSSGIIDYDSGAVIDEESYDDEFVNPAAPIKEKIEPAAEPSFAPPPVVAAIPPAAGFPSYMLEPEWGGTGTKSAREIVDLPVPSEPYVSGKPEDTAGKPAGKITEVFPEDDYEEDEAFPEDEKIKTAEAVPDEDYEDYDETAEDFPENKNKNAQAIPENRYNKLAESVLGSKNKKTEDAFPEDDYEEIAEAVPEALPENEYYDDVYIDEPDEIAEADEIDEAEELTEADYYNAADEIAEYNIVPSNDRPPSTVYGIDPAFIIPGINTAKPDTPNNSAGAQVINPINEPRYPAGTGELVRGRYYVQLASYDSAESAENGLSRIDQHYNPAIYNESGRYRVLLGPLNQGESAAVLARFKSIGYKDAFVKLAR